MDCVARRTALRRLYGYHVFHALGDGGEETRTEIVTVDLSYATEAPEHAGRGQSPLLRASSWVRSLAPVHAGSQGYAGFCHTTRKQRVLSPSPVEHHRLVCVRACHRSYSDPRL